MYFASSINRLCPYAYCKSCLGPSSVYQPIELILCKVHRYFATLQGASMQLCIKLCCDSCHLETFSQILTVLKKSKSYRQTLDVLTQHLLKCWPWVSFFPYFSAGHEACSVSTAFILAYSSKGMVDTPWWCNGGKGMTAGKACLQAGNWLITFIVHKKQRVEIGSGTSL